MKRFATILTVLILGLTASVCSAQGLTVIVDKIKAVEDKLDQVDATLNGEIEKLNGRLSNFKPTASAGSTESVKALQSQVNALSNELESIKGLLASSQDQQQVAYADLYLQISQLGQEITDLQANSAEEPPQYAGLETPVVFEQHEETPAWNNPGLEISGFFDVVSSYEEAAFKHGEYEIGEAELGIGKEISENIAVEAAIAYNSHDGVFELGCAIVDIHLFGEECDDAPLWNMNGAGLVFGQFDVPFGISLNYYPAVDRKLISGPSVVGYTHDGWNDFGVQYYMDINFANFVTYWVNGYESSFEITELSLATELGLSIGDEVDDTPLDAFGFRLGLTPLSFLEIGSSLAFGWNEEHNNEMSLFGIDGQFEWNNLHFRSEYIVHQKHKTYNQEDDKGFYAQALYSFGKPFATFRYGGTKFDGTTTWAESFAIGAGYELTEGAEVRVEYLINDENITDNLSMQLVVGF